jgi:hypothetical protein
VTSFNQGLFMLFLRKLLLATALLFLGTVAAAADTYYWISFDRSKVTESVTRTETSQCNSTTGVCSLPVVRYSVVDGAWPNTRSITADEFARYRATPGRCVFVERVVVTLSYSDRGPSVSSYLTGSDEARVASCAHTEVLVPAANVEYVNGGLRYKCTDAVGQCGPGLTPILRDIRVVTSPPVVVTPPPVVVAPSVSIPQAHTVPVGKTWVMVLFMGFLAVATLRLRGSRMK